MLLDIAVGGGGNICSGELARLALCLLSVWTNVALSTRLSQTFCVIGASTL